MRRQVNPFDTTPSAAPAAPAGRGRGIYKTIEKGSPQCGKSTEPVNGGGGSRGSSGGDRARRCKSAGGEKAPYGAQNLRFVLRRKCSGALVSSGKS